VERGGLNEKAEDALVLSAQPGRLQAVGSVIIQGNSRRGGNDGVCPTVKVCQCPIIESVEAERRQHKKSSRASWAGSGWWVVTTFEKVVMLIVGKDLGKERVHVKC